jgi:hypothetical protein
MYRKKAALVFVEITAIFVMLAALGAVAVPHVFQMVREERALLRENELEKIQGAVTTMLEQSVTGALIPEGPTTDIGNVRTADGPPLLLKDYLADVPDGQSYGFTSDGTVVPMKP